MRRRRLLAPPGRFLTIAFSVLATIDQILILTDELFRLPRAVVVCTGPVRARVAPVTASSVPIAALAVAVHAFTGWVRASPVQVRESSGKGLRHSGPRRLLRGHDLAISRSAGERLDDVPARLPKGLFLRE